MSSLFEDRAKQAVPAPDWFVLSAVDDDADDEDDHPSLRHCGNIDDDTLELPDPAGKSGGACTSALLQTLWRDQNEKDDDDDDGDDRYSWADTLELIRERIADIGLKQTPRLSTSRPMDIHEEVQIVPTDCQGVRRALLVGINYVGQPNALTSCHSDVHNMKDFLIRMHGLERQNILIMMDDGNHHQPTRQLILDSLRRLCEISKPGDCIIFQFSGHGGQLNDPNGDEVDSQLEILFPGDYQDAGYITDNEIYTEFVSRIISGVHVVAVMDCCHSGTIMDLPYVYGAGEEGFRENDAFKPIMAGTGTAIVAAGAVTAARTKNKGKDKGDKKSKKKKDGDSNGKKTKKDKDGKKKKKQDAEEAVSTADEEEDEPEPLHEEEPPEPKKKRGLLGLFGRGKK